MILDGVLFLAARTARSQAYAQAMVNAELHPEVTAVVGKASSGRPGQMSVHQKSGPLLDIYTPDYGESLDTTCQSLSQRLESIDAPSISDAAVRQLIEELSPRLIVYSGYGGEIVPGDMCSTRHWLHMHSGWLPNYRGSTTIYYSMLQEACCAVSALLLAPSIDTGPIVKRRIYPPPPPGVDIDYVYDSSIRADLLIDVLTEFGQTGALPEVAAQDEAAGQTYYVIHPVLKNLALTRNAGEKASLRVPRAFRR